MKNRKDTAVKKKFEPVEIEIIRFDADDVIVTSDPWEVPPLSGVDEDA